MKSKALKRGLVVVALGLGTPAVFWWATNQAIEDMFANDEESTRQMGLPMLDGAVWLGLYRQHMWDAVIWTVIAMPDSLPRAIAAHNAVLDSTMHIGSWPTRRNSVSRTHHSGSNDNRAPMLGCVANAAVRLFNARKQRGRASE